MYEVSNFPLKFFESEIRTILFTANFITGVQLVVLRAPVLCAYRVNRIGNSTKKGNVHP